jgi:hypothetical protein
VGLDAKVKTGLDEIRILVLGCQVLVGFQFQAVFQEQFAALPAHARAANAVALLLMVAALALLIVPGMQHALIDQHEATRRISGVITRQTGSALLPFAIALGIDVMIGFEQMLGTGPSILIGALFASVALVAWYGIEFTSRRRHGIRERRMAERRTEESTPLARRIDTMLTEARTILPGAQALLGFQLVVVLSRTFESLPGHAKMLHAVALGFVALSTVLLMTPAAYHRLVYAGEDSPAFLRLGSALVVTATFPLALGLAADTYVAIGKITEDATIAAICGTVVLCGLPALWHVYPFLAGRQRAQAARRRT